MVIYFADSLTMIADALIIAKGLNPVSLAATCLADPSYKMATLFTAVLAIGLQSQCAQAMGSGDKKRVNEIFSAGMITLLAISIILTILGFTFMDNLCRLFTAGEKPLGFSFTDKFGRQLIVRDNSIGFSFITEIGPLYLAGENPELYISLKSYLQGWFTGLPGYLFFFTLSPLVSLDGNKKLVTAATFMQSIINIGGDLLSVFVLDAGIYGVGFSTGLSYNVSACILLLNFARKKSVFTLFGNSPDLQSLTKTLRIGLPKITEQVCRIITPILVNRCVLSVGAGPAMSAFSIKASVLGFCVIISNGIAESLGLMTHIFYGEKDEVSLKQSVKVACGAHLALTSIMTVLLYAFAGMISELYFPEGTPEWSLAVSAIRCLALSLLLNGCNQMLLRFLQSARKIWQVHVFTICTRFVSVTGCTLLLGRTFEVNGLFAAIPISEAVVLLGYLVIVFVCNRKDDIWDTILLLDGDLGYDSENSFSASIATLKDAATVSQHIEAFCIEHGVEAKKGLSSALCIEELAADIIERGFSEDKKKHHCDVRVMIDPDEVVLRIRDDCPYFNICERYDSSAEDDASVWIRLVYGLAREVKYTNIFNTNTLIIRI